MKPKRLAGFLLGAWLFLAAVPLWAEGGEKGDKGFTVCWWNVENFGVADRFIDGRYVASAMKPASEINAVVAILRKIRPDILGVAEVLRDPQDRNLNLLRAVLRQGGLDYPAMATVHGSDPRIQVVLLCRFPIISVEELYRDRFPVTLVSPQTGATEPAEFRVNRGFVLAQVEAAPGYRLGVMLAHLKSKKVEAGVLPEEPGETGDAVVRRKEAGVLRARAEEFLARNPGEDLLVMGDLNDAEESRTMHAILDKSPLWALPLADWAGETWTEIVYPKEARERIDYLLVNASLRQRFDAGASYLYRGKPEEGAGLDAATGSDHRPLVARFRLGPVGK